MKNRFERCGRCFVTRSAMVLYRKSSGKRYKCYAAPTYSQKHYWVIVPKYKVIGIVAK